MVHWSVNQEVTLLVCSIIQKRIIQTGDNTITLLSLKHNGTPPFRTSLGKTKRPWLERFSIQRWCLVHMSIWQDSRQPLCVPPKVESTHFYCEPAYSGLLRPNRGLLSASVYSTCTIQWTCSSELEIGALWRWCGQWMVQSLVPSGVCIQKPHIVRRFFWHCKHTWHSHASIMHRCHAC